MLSILIIIKLEFLFLVVTKSYQERELRKITQLLVINALGSKPILDFVLTQNKKDAAYADYLNCVAKSQNLATRWHKTNKLCPRIVYFNKEISHGLL